MIFNCIFNGKVQIKNIFYFNIKDWFTLQNNYLI